MNNSSSSFEISESVDLDEENTDDMNQEEDEEKKNNFEPIEDIRIFINTRFYAGTLALYLMLFVVLYNFILFESETGYAIYYLVPVILFLGTYFLKYWEPLTKRRLEGGIVLITVFGIWDGIVSISFQPTLPELFSSIVTPTLLVDLILIAYIFYWRLKIYDLNKIGSYSDQEKEGIDSDY